MIDRSSGSGESKSSQSKSIWIKYWVHRSRDRKKSVAPKQLVVFFGVEGVKKLPSDCPHLH